VATILDGIDGVKGAFEVEGNERPACVVQGIYRWSF
jgi:hypothetical protein